MLEVGVVELSLNAASLVAGRAEGDGGQANVAMDIGDGWERVPVWMDSGSTSSFLKKRVADHIQLKPPTEEEMIK